MNAHGRRYFTPLHPCRCCGREPMRVYNAKTDRYAVKCACGNRTRKDGFSTIGGASHSWNDMNKKAPSPVCKTGDSMEKRYTPILSGRK